ncbi:MAG: hypothetical protein KAJ63_03770 [Methyloprofundus sp.]|nr:hypothetical protein [Methyloprofundus sp.]
MFNKFYGICGTAAIIMVGFVSPVSAEPACYMVSGSVTTENVTSTLQIGNISLMLGTDDEVFSETGSLVGNITGADGFGTTLLSHVARFSKGNSFNTSNDEAVLAFPESNGFSPVRLYDEEGNPCSFYIHETISSIPHGTRFFRNVTSVEIFADGYVSRCPGENENYFDLSGELCVE